MNGVRSIALAGPVATIAFVTIVVEEQPFWGMVARLRQFEGWRCLWRVPVAALLYAAVPLIFIGATVLAAFIAGNDFDLETAIIFAVIVVGATAYFAPRLARRRRWSIASRSANGHPTRRISVKIGVNEPEAWLQSKSDEDRMRRMVGILERAGIRARVGSTDAFPAD